MAVSIISSVCIWSAVLIILMRILENSGIPFKENKFFNTVLADKKLQGGFQTTNKELAGIFGITLLFRAIVILISVVAIYIFRNQEMTMADFIRRYLQWDSNNYQRIAILGYGGYEINGDYSTLVFFPLYPWVIRVVNLIIRNDIVSGVVVSSAFYSAACVYLYKLLAIDYNKSTAVRTLVYISVFPHALFFGAMMNESTLLFTICATLYYVRKHNWPMVGVFGALAALSRLAGILLAIPAAVEWLEEYKVAADFQNKEYRRIFRNFYKKGLWIFLMLAGLGIYLLCNYKTTGEWFKFLEYEEKYWQQRNCYFGSGFKIIFERLIETKNYTRYAIWIPAAVAAAFAVIALTYGLRRHRSMYTAFLLVYIVINTGITWPISLGRYMTCAVPMFIITADFSERHKWTEPLITASMAITMGIYLVAYFLEKQIL